VNESKLNHRQRHQGSNRDFTKGQADSEVSYEEESLSASDDEAVE
jgi:hypothetical protein